MAKPQAHKQFHNGKTQFAYTSKTAIVGEPQDPGAKDESQPVGSKIPIFLRETFAKKDWNR